MPNEPLFVPPYGRVAVQRLRLWKSDAAIREACAAMQVDADVALSLLIWCDHTAWQTGFLVALRDADGRAAATERRP